MGKNRKRPRSHRGKGKRPRHNIPTTTGHDDNDNTRETTTDSALRQRIIKGDSHTQLAALSVLLHATSDNNSNAKLLSLSLLSAVSNHLLNDNLDCAVVAAGCLANSLQNTFDSKESDELLQQQAEWITLLLTRLQQALKIIKSGQSATTTTSPQQQKSLTFLLWLQITERCLQCLVSLLEDNLFVMPRLLKSLSCSDINATTNLPETEDVDCCCLDLLVSWVDIATTTVLSTEVITSPFDTDITLTVSDNKSQNCHVDMKSEITACWHSIATLSARALHSMFDDNADLIVLLSHEQNQTNQKLYTRTLHTLRRILELDYNIKQASNNLDPEIECTLKTVRLHCIGIWFTLWYQTETLQSNRLGTARSLLNKCLSKAVFILIQALPDESSRQSYVQLLSILQPAYDAYMKQSRDVALERQVLGAQQTKNEPARAIARRLQKTPFTTNLLKNDEKIRADSCIGKDRVDSAKERKIDGDQAEIYNDDNQSLLSSLSNGCDQQELWHNVLGLWTRYFQRPLQLALEITANLTATISMNIVGSDGFEERFKEEHETDTSDQPPLIVAVNTLVTLLSKQDFSQNLLSLLNWLCSLQIPKPLYTQLADLQGKVGLCVGHCISFHSEVPAALWQDLQKNMLLAGDPVGCQGISMTMVMVLKYHYIICQNLRTDDVAFITDFLLMNHDDLVVRNAVSMLGIIHRHNASLVSNQRTCEVMLNVLNEKANNNAMVTAELLNAMMDIYSEDNCSSIFEDFNVLQHFQNCVPLLKQLIDAYVAIDHPVDVETVEEWKEVVLNADRFIQYKKKLLCKNIEK